MAALIIVGVIVVIVAGLWLTRNAKGPTRAEVIIKTTEAEGRVGPTGEPMGWDKPERPPDY